LNAPRMSIARARGVEISTYRPYLRQVKLLCGGVLGRNTCPAHLHKVALLVANKDLCRDLYTTCARYAYSKFLTFWRRNYFF